MTTLDQVAQHLTARGLRFRQHEDERIDIGFSGDNTFYEAVITVRGALVSVIAHNVAVVPTVRLDAATRLANLVNATRLSYGTFWVHPTRQRLAFEVPVVAPDGPSPEQIRLAMAALNAIDNYFPAFARVLWAGVRPEDALEDPAMKREDEEPPLDLAV